MSKELTDYRVRRRNAVRDGTAHYSSGFQHWRTIWTNVIFPDGVRRLNKSALKRDLEWLRTVEGTIKGSGSGTHLPYFPDDAGWGRVYYARSGA